VNKRKRARKIRKMLSWMHAMGYLKMLVIVVWNVIGTVFVCIEGRIGYLQG